MLQSAIIFGAVAAAAAVAPLHIGNETIAGSYVVVFHRNSDVAAREAHIDRVKGMVGEGDETLAVTHEWSYRTFHGYAAKLNDEVLNIVREDDTVVEFVEANQVMRISTPINRDNVQLYPASKSENAKASDACVEQKEATWGIVRTAQRDLTNNGIYDYDSAKVGKDVSAYIIDTGIYTEHVEFEGRAIFGVNTADPPSRSDGNGHGTHVAGTVGSKTYGIAKEATLVAVKVLGDDGSGSTAGVISGVEWSCKDHEAKKNKCVANLSLGGGFSLAMNRAVDELTDCGCATAVASGNEARDACLSSPASANGAYAVNAMDNTDSASYFTNYGTCTQIYAPGSAITAPWIGSQYAINTISGTSMASPHVCGIMAKIVGGETSDPLAVYDELTRDATPGKIKGNNKNTPNLLVYEPCSQK